MGRPQNSSLLKTVRLCGAVAAGFGFLALLGWALGLPFLASLGSDKIPMAPSTALLFVLYGIAAFLRASLPLGRGAHRVGVAINSAGALIASLLSVLSFLGIRPAAELLGFAVVGTVGDAPVGHMSPVTAICFLLASLSFLGSLPSSSSRPWRAAAAWWTACLLLATSSVLLLAYLFGSPLFYGGSLIPPAATTSIAFAALGTALLAVAGRQARPAGRTARPPARVPYALVLVLVLLAAGIVSVGGFYFRSDARRYRAEVEHQLSAVAELKAGELARWRAERLGDASVFLGNAPFSALARRLFDNPQDTETQAQLRTWLAKVQTHYLYDQASLLDARGAERLTVPEGRAPMSSMIARHVPDVLRSREVSFEDFYRNEHDERVYLSLLVPILDERSRALGLVALRIDPEIYLYPFINRWPTPAKTAETLLIRRDGNDALFLNELKFQKHTALALRVPLARQDVAAVKAALGQEGIVEGRDYRGVPVIAALRAVPGSPWSLVAHMDAAEVNAPLRERLLVMILLVGGMLAAAAAGVGILWREQRVRHFRERYEAEQERAWLHDVVARSLNEVYVFDPETLLFRFANLGACRNIGYTQQELAGLTPLDLKPEFTEEAFRAMVEPLRTAGRPVHVYQTVHRRKDGSEYPTEAHLQLVDAGAGAVFLCLLNDITERRRAETRIQQLNRVYAVLSDVNQAIVRVREPQALFAEACRIAVETGGFRMAWVGLLDAETKGVRPVAHAGVVDGYLDKLQIRAGNGPRGLGPTGSTLREGRHDVCNDIEHDPRMAAWRDDALARGYRASAAFPLTVNGETLGTFTLYASEPGFFDVEELRLLDEMAADLSFAMEMARLEDVGLRLATAIEQSPVSVMITDADGRIEYVNPAFARITGYPPEEALGGNPRILKSGKQELALYQELWATISAGKSWLGELVNRRKDGSLYTQELTIAPVRDAVGRVAHFVAMSQDVTERKQAAEALRSAEARYRVLFEESPHGVLLIDAETGKTLEANETAHKQLGYTREEFAALRISDYEALETPEDSQAHIQKVRSEGSDDFETLHRTKNGEIRNVHVWTKTLPLGERLAFHCIFEDITERKRAEEALFSEKAFSEAMLDSLPGIFYLFDHTGHFLRWNRSFEIVSGYSSEEIAAMRPLDFFTGEDRTLIEERIGRVFETGAADAEAALVSKDGRQTPHYLVGVRFVVDGAPCCIGTGIDVSARKLLEAELQQAQKIEAIGRLAGGVAHDFNNILGVILGYGELAESGLAPENPVREQVTEMVKAANRAAALTRQLQAFSRKQILQPRLLDLNTLVANAHKMLGRLIGEDIHLVTRMAPDVGAICADPGQIEQIILNLAVNARDAMPRGGILTIETVNADLDAEYVAHHAPVTPGRYVMLAASDNGVGMDIETQRRVFEPFFTTKPEGQGTGLGLATVYGIVKQSEGFVWVYSEPGHGTTFKIYLPRIEGSADAATPSAPLEVTTGGHETILLAEDNSALRGVIRENLAELGYTILLAADGEEALSLAVSHDGSIELLLTDVVMPRFGGGELARRLLLSRPELRVIYMSGYTDGSISHHGVLEEGVVLLMKPFTRDQLARSVRETLDRPSASRA
jgi:PAS domain S-box-containing protein